MDGSVTSECLVFCFTMSFITLGSNTHNNGNPAGDGQAGDAGEGTRGKQTKWCYQ